MRRKSVLLSLVSQSSEKEVQEKSLCCSPTQKCTATRRETHIHTHNHTQAATASCFQCLIEQQRTHRDFSASFVTSPPQEGCNAVGKERRANARFNELLVVFFWNVDFGILFPCTFDASSRRSLKFEKKRKKKNCRPACCGSTGSAMKLTAFPRPDHHKLLS